MAEPIFEDSTFFVARGRASRAARNAVSDKIKSLGGTMLAHFDEWDERETLIIVIMENQLQSETYTASGPEVADGLPPIHILDLSPVHTRSDVRPLVARHARVLVEQQQDDTEHPLRKQGEAFVVTEDFVHTCAEAGVWFGEDTYFNGKEIIIADPNHDTTVRLREPVRRPLENTFPHQPNQVTLHRANGDRLMFDMGTGAFRFRLTSRGEAILEFANGQILLQ